MRKTQATVKKRKKINKMSVADLQAFKKELLTKHQEASKVFQEVERLLSSA